MARQYPTRGLDRRKKHDPKPPVIQPVRSAGLLNHRERRPMPWSNQSGGGGGPWGQRGSGGGKSPWGPGPQGGGTPPDLEDILRRGQDRLKGFIPGGFMGGGKGILLLVLAVGSRLAADRFLHRSSERGRHQHGVREVHRDQRRRPALQLALPDRAGPEAERDRAAADRGRLPVVPKRPDPRP